MVNLRKTFIYFDLIKFQHTIFALPFALLSAFVAAGGMPDFKKLGWILVAMIGARSSAMAFNRLIDADYDRQNPRTANRHLPKGLVTRKAVWLFTFLSASVFILAAYSLNQLAFALSPIALAIILGYSFSKRFTNLSHFWLGVGLAIAPVGAWIAITGSFGIPPLWLALAVLLWTAGFDIIYACQDYQFDLKTGLFSIPKQLGIEKALKLSAILHGLALGGFAGFMYSAKLGIVSWTGLGAISLLLLYEHWIIRPDDLEHVNTAFFTVNGIISFGMMATTIIELFL